MSDDFLSGNLDAHLPGLGTFLRRSLEEAQEGFYAGRVSGGVKWNEGDVRETLSP